MLNGARTLILPATHFVISYLIISQHGKPLWGSFVIQMLAVNLIAHFAQWGSKEYLLRSFSKDPQDMGRNFWESILSRAVFLIPGLIILWFLRENTLLFGWNAAWLLGLFLYQSLEPLVVYHKRFGLQLIAEAVSFLLLATGLWFLPEPEIEVLVGIYTLALWVKLGVLLLVLLPPFQYSSIQKRVFRLPLPFVLIGLSGLLQSRIDQYIIAFYSTKEITGEYQIFISAFIYLQAFSGIIFVPFSKQLYRIRMATFRKMMQKMAGLALLTVPLAGGMVSFILTHFFEIDPGWHYYAWGLLFVFPSFIYVPLIYVYYRLHRERDVMLINYAGAFLNLAMTVLFVYKGDPFGAVIAGAIAQWAMLAWYLFTRKNRMHEAEMSSMRRDTK